MKKYWFLLLLVPIVYLLILFLPNLNMGNERNCNSDNDCTLITACGFTFEPISKSSLVINEFSSKLNPFSYQQIPGCLGIPTYSDKLPVCISNQCSVRYSENCTRVCTNFNASTSFNDARFDRTAQELNITVQKLIADCSCK